MNIGLISDIHGNYEALKVVLAELDKMNVSEVISSATSGTTPRSEAAMTEEAADPLRDGSRVWRAAVHVRGPGASTIAWSIAEGDYSRER
jgi:predicted phosphodiesterase